MTTSQQQDWGSELAETVRAHEIEAKKLLARYDAPASLQVSAAQIITDIFFWFNFLEEAFDYANQFIHAHQWVQALDHMADHCFNANTYRIRAEGLAKSLIADFNQDKTSTKWASQISVKGGTTCPIFTRHREEAKSVALAEALQYLHDKLIPAWGSHISRVDPYCALRCILLALELNDILSHSTCL
jgi:hypothetical protein